MDIRVLLHPRQFAGHVGDKVWSEVAKKVLGSDATDEKVYGRPFTAAELARK